MPIERPQVAMLADAVQTHYDGPARAEPGKGVLASLVMRLFHAAALGTFESAAEVLADDVHFEIVASQIRFPVHQARGRDAVVEAFKRNFPAVTDQKMELIAFVEDATQCVMVSHEVGRIVATGEVYEGYGTFVFTCAQGRIVHIQSMSAARHRD